MTALLEVEGLRVEVVGPQTSTLVRDVSFCAAPGEVVALVGESGAGKSATALALAALHAPAVRVSGSVRVDGRQLVGRSEHELEALRGAFVGVVFQDPSSALHPLMRLGEQLLEGLPSSRGEAEELLARLGMGEPAAVLRSYPHQLSGGMRQRALLAMALVRAPRALVLDEVTTALDAVTRLRVLDLVVESVLEREACAVLLTHDLALARRAARRASVLYAGRVVEAGPTRLVLGEPLHPYSAGLIRSEASLDDDRLPEPIAGAAPSPREELPGCAFAPRCARADRRCRAELPELVVRSPDRTVACFHPLA